jgi:hypothetical protein
MSGQYRTRSALRQKLLNEQIDKIPGALKPVAPITLPPRVFKRGEYDPETQSFPGGRW